MHDDTYAGNVQTLPQRPSVNGHAMEAPPADGRGKRVANRTPWLDLPEPWDNLKFRAWLDYPQEIADLLTAGKDETPDQASERVMEFLRSVILQHDGWEGDDGHILPQPDTAEFWEAIPTPLGRKISERFFEELTDSPTSRASRRRKLKSSRRR